MKLITHNRMVAGARPSRNRCNAGTPALFFFAQHVLRVGTDLDASDRFAAASRRPCRGFCAAATRNCSDFGQPDEHEDGDHERSHAAEVEHGSPAERRNQPGGHEARHGAAGREPDRDARHERDAQPLRAVLADERGRVRNDAAETDPGDEADERSARSTDVTRAVRRSAAKRTPSRRAAPDGGRSCRRPS